MTKLTDFQFILLDVETCNFEDPKVIELAALLWSHGRPIRAQDFKETYVNPGQKIDPASQSVHHISNKDIDGAPFLSEIDQEWTEWALEEERIIVAYNSEFDRTSLRTTGLFPLRWMDAYRGAMHFWSIGDKNKDGFPLTSLKQQELRYWLDLPNVTGDAHRAAADIQVTAHILSRMIDIYLECGHPNDITAFTNFINGPICHSVIPIGGKPYQGKTPEEIDDWAIKKAFDPENYAHESFKKFDILDCLRPEYIRRFGKEPEKIKKIETKSLSFTDARIKNEHKLPPAEKAPPSPSRWKRS